MSGLINEGENIIAVLLGNGLQNNPGGAIWDFDKAPWRGAPSFALRLNMTDSDGNTTAIESDESFKVCDSPIYLMITAAANIMTRGLKFRIFILRILTIQTLRTR